jgi:hypothetical protein
MTTCKEAYHAGLGLWGDHQFSHEGWECVDIIEDDDGDRLLCECCQQSYVRFLHVLKRYPAKKLKVGLGCARLLEENPTEAVVRESSMHVVGENNYLIHTPWHKSKAGNQYLTLDGYLLTIFYRYGRWGAYIKHATKAGGSFRTTEYPTETLTKLATLKMLEDIKYGNELRRA